MTSELSFTNMTQHAQLKIISKENLFIAEDETKLYYLIK